ncbi:proline-rich transmembrane protein 1-like [Biomphalaria glabrata]|uniref:Proline-rich transmembrane protein 1-like n=1 Tax=Biomphalaria glabrata TaxID=6526 RepID=A0A9W3BHX6_BIOGL|nr:proline-rich transmembrane protein 1-like [Biomphalaria glabrata]
MASAAYNQITPGAQAYPQTLYSSAQGGYQPTQGGYPTAQASYVPGGGYPQGANIVTQQPAHAVIIQKPPNDILITAVFVTLCCFWPTGLVAIIKASDARSAVARGDLVYADSSYQTAKTLVNISIGIGLASYFISIVIMAFLLTFSGSAFSLTIG